MLTRSAPALIVGADLSRYGPLACIAPLGYAAVGQMRRFERLGGPTASRNHDVVALSIDGIAVHSRPVANRTRRGRRGGRVAVAALQGPGAVGARARPSRRRRSTAR